MHLPIKEGMNELKQRTITGAFIGAIMLYLFFYTTPLLFSLFLGLLLTIILFHEMPRLIDYPTTWDYHKNKQRLIFIIFYPIVPFCALITLNQNPTTHILVFFIFAITFIHDISAYLVGKKFGKHRIAPSISPKKTWEGFCGGVIFVFIALHMILWLQKCNQPFLVIFLLSLSLALCATAGDFFESWLKRRAGVKDSGTLLPGHGGLLDRFDSILAVGLFVYAFQNYLLRFFCQI